MPSLAPTTPISRLKPNASVTASAAARAPPGLWAASSTTDGLRRTTSIRPGESTAAKAERITSMSSVRACSEPIPKNASTAASATAALCAWCAPYSGRKMSGYSPPSPRSVSSCPPTATSRETTPNSMPSRATVASTSTARFSSTCAASTGCCARTTVASFLTIPAFSEAISPGVEPSRSVWSREMGVTTATEPSMTLVASQLPPMPTSTTATSTGASAKAAYAMAVSTSKKESRKPCRSSVIWMYGSMSRNVSTNRSGAIGAPSRLIRSVTDWTCGLV